LVVVGGAILYSASHKGYEWVVVFRVVFTTAKGDPRKASIKEYSQ
jgi:hypothetical protein